MISRTPLKRFAAVRRSAFTLTEAVVTLSISAILMGALGSAVYIAGFAVPTKTGAMSRVSDAAAVLEAMAVDIQYAQAILEYNSQAVTVLVADRNNDGAVERVRYSWGGAGTSVMRQYNAEPAMAVIHSPQEFQLSYTTATRTEQVDGVATEDASETLLYEFASASGLRNKSMSGNTYVGQSFSPVLPGKAVGWKPTRFITSMRRALVGAVRWDLYLADADGLPTGESLANCNALLLTSLVPITFSVTNPPLIRADQSCALVGRATLGSVDVQASDVGAGLLESTSAGATWTVKNEGVLLQVYGNAIWPQSKITLSQTYAKGVTISLTTSAATTAQRIAVPTLNCPEMLSQVWQLDFSRDPTTADSNADSTADVRPADNSAVSATPVSGGTLSPTKDLVLEPANELSTPTRIDLRAKSGPAAGSSARLLINLERTATKAAPVALYLTTSSDGTSTLRVFNDASMYAKQSGAVVSNEAPVDAISSVQPLLAIKSLPRDMTDVRLVTDPDNDRVALFVGQVHQGTFTYQSYTLTSPSSRAVLGGDGGAEFDGVSIRIQ